MLGHPIQLRLVFECTIDLRQDKNNHKMVEKVFIFTPNAYHQEEAILKMFHQRKQYD